MLSLIELQNKKVEAKRKKYEKDEMDSYLDLVFDNYKNLLEENKKLQAEKAELNKKMETEKAELNKKIKTLSDGIQYYRSIETTLQKALILAEKTSKETKDAAILKAETIEKEAHKRADDIVQTAEEKYDEIKNKCIRLVQQFNQYKLQLKEAASAQLQLVDGEQFDISKPEELDKPLDEVVKKEPSPSAPVQKPAPKPVSKPKETGSPVSSKAKSTEFDSSREELLNADTIDLRTTLDTVKTEVEPEVSVKPDPVPQAEVPVKNTIEPVQADITQEMSAVSEDTQKDDILTEARIDPIPDKIEKPAAAEKSAASLDKIEVPKGADVKKATVLEPVQAKVLEPMDIIFEDEIAANEEMQNEKIEPESKSPDSVPTLDSLLQDLNINNNKKKSDDPFEFLGSVDDF